MRDVLRPALPVAVPRRQSQRKAHFTRSSEVRLIGAIRGVDDEGIALPAAARVAQQLADVWPQVRTPVQGYDANVVDLLLENRHVPGTLLKLNIAVVGLGKHGRSLA